MMQQIHLIISTHFSTAYRGFDKISLVRFEGSLCSLPLVRPLRHGR